MNQRKLCGRRAGGFILLVVFGLLTVLLGITIGFISATRTETEAVAHVRDKSDARGLLWSAVDWVTGCIAADLINPATREFDASKIVSRTLNPGDPHFRWWYRPLDNNVAVLTNATPFNPESIAPWVYLPKSYFPEGGVRGRFRVQVVDPNAFINVNDWLEDCSPTQCQMAHMLVDAFGLQNAEQYRGKSMGLAANRGGAPSILSGDSKAANYYSNYPMTPLRYIDGFCAASRTTRYTGWHSGPDSMSPNWVTSNTTWFSLYGVLYNAVKPSATQYYLDLDANNIGPSLTKYSYVDPDTGRSPVNVNTVCNSGEELPYSNWGNARAWTMEAVFNVESLRRIIKIGKFFDSANVERDLSDPAVWATLSVADKKKIEELRTKLAYRYQEVLVRYFTGCYDHGAYHAYTWKRGPDLARNTFYQPYGYTTANIPKNYGEIYTSVLGAAEVGEVKHYCKKRDHSETRFPCGLVQFREWIKDDLRAMTKNNRNIAANNKDVKAAAIYAGTSDDGIGYVGVDRDNNFEILPGKLDWRTASAIYDNIIPGKAYLFDAAEIAVKKPAYSNDEINATRDPLWDLYSQRIGRREDETIESHMDVLGHIPNRTYHDKDDNSLTEENMGRDISGPNVPYRQLAFGPDWFSTELTTTSTNFVLVVRTQLVDAITNPASPTVTHDHIVLVAVEVAPDVLVETPTEYDGANYPSGAAGNVLNPKYCGLGYYRGGRPRHYKLAPCTDTYPYAGVPALTANDLDSMDKNCGTRPRGYDPAQLPAQVVKPTTIPRDWIDYRTVAPADTNKFYRQDGSATGNQLKRRIIIRNIQDQNQSGNNS
jgi:hypothetical protein